jgi:hypothetical protein
LQKYIQEAYDAWWEEQQKLKTKFPDVPVPLNRGFQWPYQPTADLITPKAKAEAGDLNRTKEKMKWRLQRVRYPYSESPYGEKSDRTFYQYVKNHGLLKLLFSPTLLGEIWMAWMFYGYYLQEQKLNKEKKSQYGYPLRFHRDAMKQIARDLLTLEAIAAQNKVRPEWFAKYRADVLSALLREASICYPRMLIGLKSAAQFRADKSAGDTQRHLFRVIQDTFSGKSISDNFAYHLVALICSPLSSISRGELEPIPTGVGKNIRKKKKTKKQVGKSSKKPTWNFQFPQSIYPFDQSTVNSS